MMNVPAPLPPDEPTSPPLSPFVFPTDLSEWVQKLEPPFFLYDVERFKRDLASVLSAFDGYYYPLKANPHRRLIQTVLEADGGLDACSPTELELAMDAGACGHDISYCSVIYTADLVDRLAALDISVTLNTLCDLRLWLERHPGNAVSLRIEATRDGNAYGDKFGFSPPQLKEAVALLESHGTPLAGLHIHTTHVADPGIFITRLQPLASAMVTLHQFAPDMRRVNLGGGGPVRYERPFSPDMPRAYAKSVKDLLAPELSGLGFNGRYVVEPGDAVLPSETNRLPRRQSLPPPTLPWTLFVPRSLCRHRLLETSSCSGRQAATCPA